MSPLVIAGATAPDFELEASDSRRYRLSEILRQARALLVFYPGNETPG